MLFIDFETENGRIVKSRFGNGKGLNYSYLGKPVYRTMISYDGYLRNKDRSPHKQLVDQCIEAIQTFGPAYYQPEGRYSIREGVYMRDGLPNSVSKYNGRWYYSITFENVRRETMPMKSPFCAEVCIWKDTGEIWSIIFGNYEEISFIGYSYEEEKQNKDHRVVPLEIEPCPE